MPHKMVKLHLQEKQRRVSCPPMKFSHSHQQKISASMLFALAALALIALAYSKLPTSWQLPCLLHQWSGFPCPTCGATRCASLLLQGSFQAAFLQQPLIFCTTGLIGLLFLYRLFAQLLHRPTLRIHLETKKERLLFALLITTLITANWIYLIGQA